MENTGSPRAKRSIGVSPSLRSGVAVRPKR